MERSESTPTFEVDNGQAAGATSDQLYVELQLVARRLRRADALLGAVAVGEPGLPAWTDIRARCADALSAVVVAAAAVPDARPEYVHEPRQLLVRDLRLDPYARRVWYADTELELAKKEFALLGALALDPTRVHTRHELLVNVWEFASSPRTRTVDTHASRLRRKLVAGGACPDEWVVNHHGVGYALIRSGGQATPDATRAGGG